MDRFEFDPAPSPGTNRTAAVTDCPTCQGHRLVPVDPDEQTYARCPDCNAAPTVAREPVDTEVVVERVSACILGEGTREPVAEDAWWKR